MKTFTLLLLLAMAPIARADESYDLIHGLAHLGAGELIAAPIAVFLGCNGFGHKHPIISGIFIVGLPVLVGYLKEQDDREHGGVFNYRQWGATAAGGFMVEATVLAWR